jgi:actin
LTQLVFEKYNFPHFYFQLGSVLSLYSSGKTTAVVLDMGAACTYALPIYEGY